MLKVYNPPNPHAQFPARYFGPNGATEVFASEADVPEGWEDHPEKVGVTKIEPLPLKRKQIVAALREKGVEFDPEQSSQELYDLLVAKVESES